MNAIVEHRTPEVIAAEIRSIDAQTREIVLRSAVEIGNRLNEAKALVPHGEWGAWLQKHVNYSQSTANNFMRVAEEYGSNYQALGNITYTQAVALLAVPAEERAQFASEVGAENLSTRELKEAVKARKEAESKAKMLEAELKRIEAQAEEERRAREELQGKVATLQIELAEAKIAGNAEEAAKVQQELADAQAKVKELEQQLRTKPIDVPAIVERTPPEVEAELAELRKKAALPTGAAAIKFKFQFEALAEGFRGLLTTLDEVRSSDPEQAEKFAGAVRGLIGKMQERL